MQHTKHNAFRFNESKHSALSAMCYLSQVKHCKTNAMLICVLQRMLSKTQTTQCIF